MKSAAPALEEWIAAESRFAARSLLGAISATHLETERVGLGQRIVPLAGSVLASPLPAHYDPDPDYFFHWFRDAAIVIDALRAASACGFLDGGALARFSEFVQFNLSLRSLDGRRILGDGSFRTRVQPAFLPYLRPDEELAALWGSAVWGDVRVNADGTADILRWSRPQSDGPALSCLALLRWWPQLAPPDVALRARVAELLGIDLDFTLAHAHRPCVDLWEEHDSHHYYTQLLQAEALSQGARWRENVGEAARAADCADAAAQIGLRLGSLWVAAQGYYRSRAGRPADAGREPDIAVILGVLHAARARGPHSVLDPRVQATLTALEALFEAEYPINRELPAGHGPAMGRYPGDRYYSGGAYYFATLAAAEFYFGLAEALARGEPLALTEENRQFRERLGLIDGAVSCATAARLALQRGDAFMRTVRAFTPAGGELSEQFDRATGVQTSAKHLSWSYAALVTAAARREKAQETIRGATPAAPPEDRT